MLVVGRSEPCHIRVSSKILSLASEVFKAMFNPRFQEGSMLRSAENRTAEPLIVTLPEDDSAAMLSLCQLLHYQTDMIDPHPDVTALLTLATVCDKYNCAGAIRYASHIWLNPLVDSSDISSLNKLLISSYLFDYAEVFTKVTRKMLEKWTGSLKELMRDDGGPTIPTSIYGELSYELTAQDFARLTRLLVTLEGKQNDFHYHVERSLQEMLAKFLKGDDLRCNSRGLNKFNKKDHIGACVTAFIRIGLWPISRTSNISTTLEQLNAFQWTTTDNRCPYVGCAQCELDFKPKAEKIREEALRRVEGLCLDCIHYNGHHLGICRVPHSKENPGSVEAGDLATLFG